MFERASNDLRISAGVPFGFSRAIDWMAFFMPRNSMYDGMTFMREQRDHGEHDQDDDQAHQADASEFVAHGVPPVI